MTPDTSHMSETPSDNDEIVYFSGSPALRGSLGLFIWTGLAGAALIAIAWLLHERGVWILPTAILAAIVLIIFPILLVRSVRYRISNYRIDFERGVFSKDIDTLELWHVEDIQFHQSLLDRLMCLGTITVISHDETTPRLPIPAPFSRP
jgi:membrane protein YdbS with pleckstrin-like domain